MGNSALSGLQGATGPQGPQGPAGTNGTNGATGPQGPAGTAPVPTTNAQIGTTYTLAIGDQDNIVELNNAGAITLTIPLNSSVAFAVGHSITLIQTGAGQVTIAATGGVTLNSTPGLKIAAQWGAVTLLKRATDTWIAFGNLTA